VFYSYFILLYFRSCSETLKTEIENLINVLGNKFCSQYCQVDHNSELHSDFAEKRLTMAKTWFYKLFENIIAKEAKNPKYDIKVFFTVIIMMFIILILHMFLFLVADLSYCFS